ncbi:MAG: hypothetical protein RIG84_12260 [Roseovarius sp.]
MTLQNRVLPTGEIVADPARGTLMGNRGILHDDTRRLGKARWTHQAWVTCRLTFKGRRRSLMAPGRYTELFFLDEAVALAAGHRPCAECRRDAYRQFRALWAAAHGESDLKTADRMLHRARVARNRAQIRHEAPAATLPDGAFILHAGAPCLVLGPRILRYTAGGYTAALPRPRGIATVLTPAPTRAVLAQGYRPALHPSAASFD